MDFIKFPKTDERINTNNILSYSPVKKLSQHHYLSPNEVIYSIFIKFRLGSTRNFAFDSKKERDRAILKLDDVFTLTNL